MHRLDGSNDHYERLRETVRSTHGAVLIASPCVGRCELSSLAGVGRRHGPTGQIGSMVWFAEVEDGTVFEALLAWIASGGPQQIHRPDLSTRLLDQALDMTEDALRETEVAWLAASGEQLVASA